MCASKGFVLTWCFWSWSLLQAASAQQDVAETVKKIRECVASDQPILCLKERALDALNETIASDKPITIFGVIDIVRNPEFKLDDNLESNFLPRDLRARSAMLNDMIYDKVKNFLGSRTIQICLGDIIEGRGKKDKNKGGMLMMGGLAMAGMMAQMFMGKIAFMAGAALLLAKLALMLSTIIGFKKLSGGGGGGGDIALRKSLLLLGGLSLVGMMIQKFVGIVGFFKATSSIMFFKLAYLALATYSNEKNKKFKVEDYLP